MCSTCTRVMQGVYITSDMEKEFAVYSVDSESR